MTNRIMQSFRECCAHASGMLVSLIAVVLPFYLSSAVVAVISATGWHSFESGIHLGWTFQVENPLDGIREMENRI